MTPTVARRSAAALALLALGLAACGGSDGDQSRAVASGSAPSREGAEQRIRAIFGTLTRSFPNAPARYCVNLTASAKREVEYLTIPSSGSCAAALRTISRNRSARPAPKPPKVLAVRVDGMRAKVAVEDGSRRRSLPFVRGGDDRWRLDRVVARAAPETAVEQPRAPALPSLR